MYTLEQLQNKSLKELKGIGWELNVIPEGDRRCSKNWIDVIAGVNPPLLQLLEVSPAASAQQPIIETVEASPAAADVQAQEPPIESKFGRIVYPRPVQKAIEVQAQAPMVPAVKTSPGVNTEQVQEIIDESWTSWEKEHCAWLKDAEWCIHRGENKRILAFLPVSKSLRLEGMEPGTEYCAIWEVSECTYDFEGNPLPVCSSLYTQKPIEQAAKTSPGVEVDRVSEPIETTETQSKFDCPTCKAVGSLHIARDCCLETWFIQCLHCDYHRLMNPSSAYLCVPDPAKDLFGIFPFKDDLLRRLELQATEANEFPPPAQARFQVGDLVKSVAQRWGISPDLTGEVVMVHPSGGLFVHFGSGGGQTYSRFQSKDLIKLEPIEEVQAQEPIEPVPKNPPGVEVERVQEPVIETVETSVSGEVDRVQEAIKHRFLLYLKDEENILWYDGKDFVSEKWSAKTYCSRGVGAAKHQLYSHPQVKRVFRSFGNTLQVAENSPGVKVDPVSEPISQVAKTSPGVEVQQAQEPISQVAETSPGVEVDQSPDCAECFGGGYFEDESGLIKFCHCSDSEQKLSRQNAQRAIAPATSDLNPNLTGLSLSDRFLARYSPPQPEIEFNVGTDGQLNLLDFKVGADEPPDPDDFDSLYEFREAIARWDCEHPSTLDHCSDLPSSVYREPPDPDDFDSMFAFWAAYDAWDKATDDDDSDEPPSSEDNDVSSEDNDVSSEDEPLELSLDSFCLWAHSPIDWYEPVVLIEQSKVSELSLSDKSSITSDFFIPTFDRKGDLPNGSDEPPDAGIFARLPKPKSPTFPPQASQPKSAQIRASQFGIPKLSRSYPETIPKLFPRVVAGSSTQPARSPPGGDAIS